MEIGGVPVDPMVVFIIAGAVGGLLRTINWKIENPIEGLNPWEVARNIVVGGVCGYAVDGSFLGAFTAGLSGEWLVQKVVSKADTKLGLSEKIPKIKSLIQ